MSKINEILQNYHNPASVELLNSLVKSGTFSVVFEFNKNQTELYFRNIKTIFNISYLHYVNEIATIDPDVVDAVFIMIPYDRPDRLRTVQFAVKNNKPIFILEAGFVSSYLTLNEKESPISFHVDTVGGIYLDSHRHNEVLDYLNGERELTIEETRKVEEFINIITSHGISKYNNFVDDDCFDIEEGSVLVVDQTLNDYSIVSADANSSTFDEMIRTAISENPTRKIYIKCHPEVIIGARKGNIDIYKYSSRKNVAILTKNINPKILFSRFSDVYVVSSTLGFEALLYGRRVHCFGAAFYAGWGITVDYCKCANRLRKRNLFDLAYAIYIRTSYWMSVNKNEKSEPVSALRDFCEYINFYKENKCLKYIDSSLKARISELERDYGNRLAFFENKLKRLEKESQNINAVKNKEVLISAPLEEKITVDVVSDNKIKEKSETHRFERFIMKKILKGNYLNKYMNNRRLFFNDSNNVFVKLYWKILCDKDE